MGAFHKQFGERLRHLRKASGLTQEELAKRAGISWKFLGAIERAERDVTLGKIEGLIKALSVAPYELFLFNFPEGAGAEKVNEEVLLRLIKHTDPAVRPLVMNLVHSVLRWTSKRQQ